MGRARVLPVRHVLLVLKALNLVAITVYSFGLIYVLARILTFDLYPLAVLISSVGAYIMATDLGYSGFIYYRTRRSFLARAEPDGTEAEAFTLYVGIAVAAAAAACVAIMLVLRVPLETRAALSLYFLSIVLALPWGLVRKVAAAVDLYLAFEIGELIRRLVFAGLAAGMLAGLPFIAFTLLCLLVWSAAFVTALGLLRRRRGMQLANATLATALAHLRCNFANIGQSGALTLTEFAIYNFPYFAIAALFEDKTLIVAFDIFYKVVRFGAVSYGVAAETYLPGQTRAYYAQDRASVMQSYQAVLVIGLLPLAVAAGVLLGYGDHLFAALLARGGVVTPSLREAMVIMLAAVLFQASAGTFLLGAGNYGRLSRFALITLGLMAGVTSATWAWGLPFSQFMYLYVLAYCVHAVFYTGFMLRFTAAMRRPSAAARAT